MKETYFSHRRLTEHDVRILTSGGRRIAAHSAVLASASPVLENVIDTPWKHRSPEKFIRILGVPCDAVSAFVEFLYSCRCTEEQVDKYGMHMLALSHVYSVSHLKQRCSRGLSERLTIENVIDVLQLARLCDASDLYLKCMKLVSSRFKAVEQTEGWKFMHDHDGWLELEILRFIDEAETRKKKTKRRIAEQSLYIQLSEAMECLEHIYTEGCTNVGPYDMEPNKVKGPCSKFRTCQGLQLLIRHFAQCKHRVNRGCSKCKRVWQLLRLHAFICDHPGSCRIPLCRQFKLRAQQAKGSEGAKWRLLARKVVSAKAISSLSLSKRKREEMATERKLVEHVVTTLTFQRTTLAY